MSKPVKWLKIATAALGDAWLVLGLTLVAFLAVDAVYRGVAGSDRPDTSSVVPPQHPYRSAPWWLPFQAELTNRQSIFDSYRSHWAGPTAGAFINVDSGGRRVTPQAGPGPRKVYLLGGSTMWGFTARDSFTIPAETARALEARGITDVEVVNLAQAAYNSTQELNTLILEIVRGRPPALAVFLDGFNDIATGWVTGQPGQTYGADRIQQQIDLGRRGFWEELIGLGRHSAIVHRLQVAAGLVVDRRPTRGRPEGCGAVAEYYHRIARVSVALGEAHGFPVRYFLQPVHASSGKRLTEWEQALPIQAALAPCIRSIDSAAAGQAYFTSLSTVFDDDTATVFVDQNAHITEAGNRRVGEAIAAVIAPLLQSDR